MHEPASTDPIDAVDALQQRLVVHPGNVDRAHAPRALASLALVAATFPAMHALPLAYSPSVASCLAVVSLALMIWSIWSIIAWLGRGPALAGVGVGLLAAPPLLFDLAPLTRTVLLLAGCAGIGWLLARQCERLWWPLVIGFLISIADAISVLWSGGITNKLHPDHGSSTTSDLLSLAQPLPGLPPIASFGITDFLFAGFFLAVARTYRVGDDLRWIIAIWLAFLASLFIDTALGGVGLPALVTIVLASAGMLVPTVRANVGKRFHSSIVHN